MPQMMAAQPAEISQPHLMRHPLIAAIQDRWSLFNDADLERVRTRPELITALQSKYRITEEQATAQVRDWAVKADF